MNIVPINQDKLIDLSKFRFARQPAFNYSQFAPATQVEWQELQNELGLDAIRNAFARQKDPIVTYRVGHVDPKATPPGDHIVLCTYGCKDRRLRGLWFAGVVWAPATPEEYLSHVPGRMAAIGGPVIIESGAQSIGFFLDCSNQT